MAGGIPKGNAIPSYHLEQFYKKSAQLRIITGLYSRTESDFHIMEIESAHGLTRLKRGNVMMGKPHAISPNFGM